jgi:hypothetical protein
MFAMRVISGCRSVPVEILLHQRPSVMTEPCTQDGIAQQPHGGRRDGVG